MAFRERIQLKNYLIMTSNFIYIDSEGVPCAPTKPVPLFCNYKVKDLDHHSLWEVEQVKKSAIPIREEDREYVMKQMISRYSGKFSDTFIGHPFIEPYEFDIFTHHGPVAMTPRGLKHFDTKYAIISRKGNTVDKVPPFDPFVTAAPKHRNRLDNFVNKYGSKSSFTEKPKETHLVEKFEDGRIRYTVNGEEVKPDPLSSMMFRIDVKPEKELFSIKELEWIKKEHNTSGLGDTFRCETPFFIYQVSYEQLGIFDNGWKYIDVRSIEDAKRQATAHYRERIMQCLNREV